MKPTIALATATAVAVSSPVTAADTAASTPAPAGQVLLMSACPSDIQAGKANAVVGILGVIGGAILKNLVVKAADYVSGLAAKQNAKLSAVSTYEGYGWFYGPDRLSVSGAVSSKPADVAAGCVVVARYQNLADDERFSNLVGQKGTKALFDAGLTGAYDEGSQKVYTPEFYAELRLERVLTPTDTGTAAYGFRMAPSKVYFGRTQAKAGRNPTDKKTLRLEVELRRFQLDKGTMAEKPFYTGAFDIGEQPQRTLLDSDAEGAGKLDTLKGPLAAYPVPAQLKKDALQLVAASGERKLISGPTASDPILVAGTAKLVEAGDPGILMTAIAKAMTDNKTKIEEAATSAALKAVADLTD